MRLLDQIRTGAPLSPIATYVSPTEWQAFDLKFRQELDRSVEFFLADNVDAFFYETHPYLRKRDEQSFQPGFEDPTFPPLLLEHEYPNAIPPYPRTWVEWTPSLAIWREEIERMGALVLSAREDSGDWEMTIFGFIKSRNHSYVLMNMFVDRVRATSEGICKSVSEGTIEIGPSLQTYGEATALCSLFMHVPLLTFCFLQCRNVHVDWITSPERWTRRFKEKHAKLPTRRIGTIVITPMSRLVAAAVEDETDPARRTELAACKFRAHRKTYTEQGKLFGKWTGTYVWNWHSVNPNARRSVENDYRINLTGINRKAAKS